jgi:two-component system cell cycle sensor histidine kinase/response regulator CckA
VSDADEPPPRETNVPISTFDTTRLRIAKTVRVGDGDTFRGALELALRISARALGVDRVSVWLFTETRDSLVPHLVFDKKLDVFVDEAPIPVELYRAYFEGIESSRTVTASDAVNDPRTAALAPYFAERGIGATMDAGIFRGGRVVGVVCHEHVGEARSFTTEQRMFAASVADLVSLLMEQEGRADVEAALREREQRLREAERSRELAHLAGVITHDFNNLLSIIAAQTSVALRPERTEAQRLAALGEIKDATSRASALARQLLAFGRRLALDVKDVDLATLVRDAKDLLVTLAGARHVMRFDVPATASSVRCDGAELERVLVNLVANARDAMPEGGPIDVRVRTESRTTGDVVVLEVQDEGIGMDDSTRARLFEPYFTTKANGTGLGLAAAHGIVTACGGRMEVASARNKGATFRVVFPLPAAKR